MIQNKVILFSFLIVCFLVLGGFDFKCLFGAGLPDPIGTGLSDPIGTGLESTPTESIFEAMGCVDISDCLDHPQRCDGSIHHYYDCNKEIGECVPATYDCSPKKCIESNGNFSCG